MNIKTITTVERAIGIAVASAFALIILALLVKPAKAATVWSVGDVFVGVASGTYHVYDNAGVFKEAISDGIGGLSFTTGCAFNNSLDKLYTTYFSQTKVKVYDDAIPHAISQVIDTAVNSPGGQSESVVFAANGDFYVGHPDGNDDIHRYNAAGTYQQSYDVAVESRGSDWMDLASDQTTMYYTSEGRLIKKYDVSGAGAQLADLTVLPGAGIAFALRLLPPGDGTGGLLVADNGEIKRLDAASAVVQTYDVPGEDTWFSLNLDPNGTSFWAGNYGSSNFYRFGIASGLVEVGPINTGTATLTLFGICVKGEPTAANPEITLDPPTASNAAGTNHTVTATVTQGGQPVVGTLVSFSVAAGPNTGQVSDPGECSVDPNCNTDAAGQTSWTYASNGATGTDVIVACFLDEQEQEHCVRALKEWVDTTPPRAACIETINPHGLKIPPAGKTTLPGPRGGDNEDGFYELFARDLSGIVSLVISDAFGSGPFAVSPGDKVKITEAPGGIPSSKPMGSTNGQAGAIATHITLLGDAILTATDGAGNVTVVSCLVPPPPK